MSKTIDPFAVLKQIVMCTSIAEDGRAMMFRTLEAYYPGGEATLANMHCRVEGVAFIEVWWAKNMRNIARVKELRFKKYNVNHVNDHHSRD